MTENVPDSTPTAPLISLRRSFQLRMPGILLMGIGIWLVVGLFGLYRDLLPLTGTSTGWVYLLMALLMLPTTFSYLELRSWIGHSGGSYRLIRAMERANFTFFAGWTYVLGWAAVSALIAWQFATFAGKLIDMFTPWHISELPLVVVLLVIFAAGNVVGTRPRWRLAVWLASGAIVFVVGLIVMLAGRVAAGQVSVSSSPGTTGHFFGALLAATCSLWVIELIAEMTDRRRSVRSSLLLLGAGPLLAMLFTLLTQRALPGSQTIEALTGVLLPGYGQVLMLVVGLVSMALAWQILGLIMLRRFQIIALDGWLPEWLSRSYSRFKTPIMLIVAQCVVSLGALLLGMGMTHIAGGAQSVSLNLAKLGALAFLILHIGVNTAAIVLASHPRAADRSFRLPLYPIVPATGAGIDFLLILAASWPVVVVGAIWFAIGGLVYWRVGLERMRSSQLGVTIFQDTTRRPDVISNFPVVVPVANPETAHSLVEIGAAVARKFHGHLSIVQVILVPDQLPLDSGRFQAQHKLDVLERVIEDAERYGVPVEGVTRLSRSIPQGILDTVSEESAEVLVMGWNARADGIGRHGLGHILDEVIENAACDVIVIRGEWLDNPKRVLVPIAGGPHAPRAAEMALALTSPADGEVTLLNVIQESADRESTDAGHMMLEDLRSKLSEPERVVTQVVKARAPLPAILDALEQQDAVLIGASEVGFLDRQLFGQIPLQLSQQTDKPLGLVRSYTGLTNLVARKAWQSLSNLLPTLDTDEQLEVYQRMRQAAQPNINYFVLITLSAMIATLGLLLNSPAVVIGAMLVAPLMSPIVATGIGIVFGDVLTLRNALTSTLQGVVAGIFIALLSTIISPLATATPEVLARTQPSLLDLMVALVSGMAGAYAIARKEVGEALPGVAIAAALMPPVCTIGIGIALGSVTITLGALLLFTTNLVAIIFASVLVFLLLGIRPPRHPDRQRRLRQGLLISVVSLLIISVPLAIVLQRSVESERVASQAQDLVQQTVSGWNAQLAQFSVDVGWRDVTITGTLYAGNNVTASDIQTLDQQLETALARNVHIKLFVVQGTEYDSTLSP